MLWESDGTIRRLFHRNIRKDEGSLSKKAAPPLAALFFTLTWMTWMTFPVPSSRVASSALLFMFVVRRRESSRVCRSDASQRRNEATPQSMERRPNLSLQIDVSIQKNRTGGQRSTFTFSRKTEGVRNLLFLNLSTLKRRTCGESSVAPKRPKKAQLLQLFFQLIPVFDMR